MTIKTLVCLISLFLALTGNAVAALTVGGGRIVELQDGTQLIFDISAAAAPETFLLDNPPRYVIDLRNAAAQGLNLRLKSRDVRSVRTGSANGRDLRIVLDLNQVIRGKASIVKDQRHRLIIDLFRNEPGQALNATSATTAPSSPPLQLISKPAPSPSHLPELALVSRDAATKTTKPQTITRSAPKIQPVTKPKTTAAKTTTKPSTKTAKTTTKPAAPSKPVTTVQRRKRNIVIAIDPGHGGKDSGAVGPAGTREKDVVLQIAKRLKKAIDKEPGISAFLTRSNDKYLRLYRRIAIARSKKADIFVSIHADAYFDAGPRGASVFMLSTKGASSTMARWLAESENKSDRIDAELNIDDKQLREVVFDMVHDAVLADSTLMAGKVLGQLRQVGKLHSRKVERANFAVLKSPDIPSILVETAFISNPDEERKLRSSRYQKKLANAILQGIKAYIKERPLLGVELIETSAVN